MKKDIEKDDEEVKISGKLFDPKKYVEINPILEDFVDDVFEGGEDIFSDDYTYDDLLYAVTEDDYEYFEEIMGAPSQELFNYLRDLADQAEEDEEHLDDGTDLGDDEDEVLGEAVLNLAQRRRRAMNMRRLKGRMKSARARAARRKASPEKLKARARKKARDIMRKKFSQKRNYKDMSPSEKMQIDKRLERVSPSVIDRIATRQLPGVRRAEQERLARRSMKKESVSAAELMEITSDLNSLFESKFG